MAKHTLHGMYAAVDATTWCGVPKIGMHTTSRAGEVTCKRCRAALKRDLDKLAKVVQERRRGAPVTTGRGGPSRRRLTLSFSPREWAEMEREAARCKKTVAAFVRYAIENFGNPPA